MRIVTYNLNGIRARLPRLAEYLASGSGCAVPPGDQVRGRIGADRDIRAAGYRASGTGRRGSTESRSEPSDRPPTLRRVRLPGADEEDLHSRYIEAAIGDVVVARSICPTGIGRHREFDYKLAGWSGCGSMRSSFSPRSGRWFLPGLERGADRRGRLLAARDGPRRFDAAGEPRRLPRIVNQGWTDAIRAATGRADLDLLGLYGGLLAARRRLP